LLNLLDSKLLALLWLRQNGFSWTFLDGEKSWKFSVEITKDNKKLAYPNEEWNSWEIGSAVEDQKFIGVQSVVAFENKLYVLDTQSIIWCRFDAPRLCLISMITT
jgi:hypothetical protein